MIVARSGLLFALLGALLMRVVHPLQIVHGQGRRSHFLAPSLNASRAYTPLDLHLLGKPGSSDYRLRHNVKYDFWFFTNSRFFGPHTDGMYGSVGESEGMMMQPETDFAASRLREAFVRNNGSCIAVDVGSNFGFFSLLAMRLGCRVYAFEPARNNFDLSILNFRINGFKNWVAINHPAGPAGTDVLFDGWSSMNQNAQNKSATRGVEPVPISYIAERFEGNSSERPFAIDWLKVDVEGFEQSVLLTVPPSIPVRALSIEVTFYLLHDIDYTQAYAFMHARFTDILDVDNGVQVWCGVAGLRRTLLPCTVDPFPPRPLRR